MKLDLLVIGTGAAASTAAYECRASGWQVAVVDSRPFGGTCALRGCDPKKVLVGAAEVVDACQRMRGKGIQAERVGIDWPELMRFKRSFTDPVPPQKEQRFAKAGIVTLRGRARFLGPTTVQVGEQVLEGRHVLVATGAKPAPLHIPGEEHVLISDQFLELDALPGRIAFIGGGYISFEFAHVAARAGVQVTILHRGEHPLNHFDPDLVDLLVQRTRGLGVSIRLQTEVRAIERTANEYTVHATTAGQDSLLTADLVVHGAGRVPEIDDLDLDRAGIQYHPKRGVTVNDYLQSVSNPAVYAAGDASASDGPPLTPVASHEGEIVAANLLGRNSRKPDYLAVPTVVFTVPPLAAAGLSERRAREQGRRFRVQQKDTSGWYSSRRIGESGSGFKVLVEEGSGRMLGAHFLGAHADETINLFALAIRSGLPARQLLETMFAYPTHASDIQYMVGE